MKLFENGVGRPSNDTIKKRKIIVGSGIAVASVLVIALVVIGVSSFSSNSTNLTADVSGVYSDSKLVISSRKVRIGTSRLLKRDIYSKEYYINEAATKNIDVHSSAATGKLQWRMVTLFGGDRPVGSGWTTFTPAVFGARYYCMAYDLDGNLVESNSIFYFGL